MSEREWKWKWKWAGWGSAYHNVCAYLFRALKSRQRLYVGSNERRRGDSLGWARNHRGGEGKRSNDRVQNGDGKEMQDVSVLNS